MNKRLFLLIVPVLLLASCQRENEWDGSPDIQATVEPEQKTRTSLSVDETGAGTIFWNPADQIDVFFGTVKASYTSQNTTDASTAVFKTNDSFSGSGFSSTDIWGLYPSNSSSCCDGNAITTTLPSSQLGVPGSFDDDLFLAVAHSSTTSLQFYNVCGGIKFNLAFDDIKKITFRGNNNEDIAGTVSISFVDGLPKATIVNGVKEITLTPKTGATFTKGSDYYFTILPCTLSEGFTMEFTTEDGSIAFFDYSESSVTIKRSVFGKKGNLDVYASFGDERQPNNVIYYTSSDGNVVTPYKTDVFGANIVSNEYVGGRGVITFDGDVTSIGRNAFYGCSRLTSFRIPNSVVSIDYYAFGYCSGLTRVDLPNSVTSIGNYSFGKCSGLVSITIPNSVTTIGYNPLEDCPELTSIIVESSNPVYDSRDNCNAIIKTETNELISGCRSTVIPNSVIRIGLWAFNGCNTLRAIVIPNSVKSISSYAFERAGLISIVIPNSITDISGNPFQGCRDLTSIIVESGNSTYDSRSNCNAIINTNTNELITGCQRTIIPQTVSRIGWDAFSECYDLEEIEIPNSVTEIGSRAFNDCIRLTSITIPDSVTSIGQSTFHGCCSLTSVTVYPMSPPTLFNNYAFYETNNCPIYVPSGSVEAYKTAPYWSVYADRIHPMGDYYEAVDLGLSVEWAACNVGASAPEELGDYFAWGETEQKSNYDSAQYQWVDGYNITKYYCYNEVASGVIDNKLVLDLSDDAAHVHWGGDWRMPTREEAKELLSNCSWQWVQQEGVTGLKVTGRNGNSIFLPVAGYKAGSTVSDESRGYYWTSSLWGTYPSYASNILFGGGDNGLGSVTFPYYYHRRFYGLPIRPVYGAFIPVDSVNLSESSLTLQEGGTAVLTVSVTPVNATSRDFTWSCNDNSIATVEDGTVTAVSPGTATITVWASDGVKSATCTVTVVSTAGSA